MANENILGLPVATVITGQEWVPVSVAQAPPLSNVTKRAQISQFPAPISSFNTQLNILGANSSSQSLRPLNVGSLLSVGPLTGYYRTYVDSSGGINTQSYIVVSGIYNDLGTPVLQVVPPGATHAAPGTTAYNAAAGGTGGMVGISNDVVGANLLMQDNKVSGGQVRASQILVASVGSGYSINDVLTVSGGTPISGNATTLKVTVVNSVGGVVAATINNVGLYAFATAPVSTSDYYRVSGTVSVTGGGGSGATFNIIYDIYANASGQIAALDFVQNVRFILTGDGRMYWNSFPTGDPSEFGVPTIGNFFTARTNLYASTSVADTLVTDGYISAGYGVRSSGFGDLLGNRAIVSVTRSVSGTSGATIEIGKIVLNASGPTPTFVTVTVCVDSGMMHFNMPLVFQIGLLNNSTNAVGTFADAWASVPPSFQWYRGGGADTVVALDAFQDSATNSLKLRLRTTNLGGSQNAQTASVTIEATGDYAPGSVTLAPINFYPSTTTASGASAPTIYWPTSTASQLDLKNFQYATPSTGDTITLAANIPLLVVNPASGLSALTIRLPQIAYNGEIIGVSFIQAVTTLSITDPFTNPAVGAPTTTVANTAYKFVYRVSDAKWYLAA